jgi:hypothetical protein
MIEVRPAFKSDIDWLFEQCEAFAKFYGSKISLAGNPDYGKWFLGTLIENHYVSIGMIDDVRAGFIAGLIAPHHFNPEIKQLNELLWWVTEDFRNSGVGSKLFKDFIAYGTFHCDWITFTLEENSPVSDKALIDQGFRLTERAYLLECK